MSFFLGTALNPHLYHVSVLAVLKLLLGGVLDLAMALFIASKSRGKPAVFALSLMFFFGATWVIPSSLEEMARRTSLIIWYGRAMLAGACLLIPSSFFFSCAIFDQHKKKAALIIGVYLAGLFFAVTSFFPKHLMATGRFYLLSGGVPYTEGSAFFKLAGIFLTLVQFGAIYNLIQGYRGCSNALEKEKLKYVLAGYCAAVLGDIDILPGLGFNVYPYGAFLQAIWLWTIAYAIVSRKLLDIRTVALKTVVWLATSLVVLVPLCLLLWLMRPWLVALPETNMLLLLLMLFIAFAFYWSAMQGKVDQIFQRRRYNLKQVLANYVSDLGTLTNLRQVQSQLGGLLKERLYVETLSLFVAEEGAGRFQDLTAQEAGTPRIAAFAGNNPFVRRLYEKNEILLSNEFPALLQGASPELQEAALKFFAFNEAPKLIVPLATQAGFVGWIALGPRMDDKPYGPVELEFLDQLRKSLAVALSNSLLYDQVQQFNVSLEATVKQRTQELQKANERLKELDVAKTEFLAMANHELRHPLAAVRGFSEMLTLLWDKTPETRKKEILATIYDSSTSMLTLINDFLDISKIELGHFELNRALVSLRSLADKVAEQMRVQHKDLTFTVDFESPDAPLNVDGAKLEQVLMNLASNAVKYSPEKGTVAISGKKEEGQFVIAVEDEGPGIPEEHIGKLFQKFYRIETADPEARKGSKAKGTGLGLTIAKSIVEMHGGRIWVENRKERSGAKFCFALPLSS